MEFLGGAIAGALVVAYGFWVAWRLWDRRLTGWPEEVNELRCPGCGDFKDVGEHGPNQGFGGCV